MEKESKEVVLPDFTEAAEKYHNENMFKSDASMLPYGQFKAGANHGYLLGYNESHSKLKLRIEELEKVNLMLTEKIEYSKRLPPESQS
jgi:hypothetical protein